MYSTRPIILASKSPRRKQLLEWAEVPFSVVVEDTNEDFPEGLSPAEAAMHIAKGKAEVLGSRVPEDAIIVAADTIVVLDTRIIGKPRDRMEALETLTALSGRRHEVITGVCIRSDGKNTLFANTTQVEFHPLTAEQINFYIDKYQPFDKAGAYAIQEWIGVTGIRSIQGDFYNVMGLPVSRVIPFLRD